MTDCYSILGVQPSASAGEIRLAYLARMKALHPDAIGDAGDRQVTASDVTRAYWQLRDPVRRAEYDAFLRSLAPAPRKRRPATVRKRSSAKGTQSRRGAQPPRGAQSPRRAQLARRAQLRGESRSRRSARLQPVRAAAGALAFGVAAVGFVLAFTYLQPQGAAPARAAGLIQAGQREMPMQETSRRVLDPRLVQAANDEFTSILRASGIEGAHLYGRQCLTELAGRPTLSLLDYCLAFDDAGARWEARPGAPETQYRHFQEQQRFGRYHSLSQSLREGAVREALLNEASYFANAGGSSVTTMRVAEVRSGP